MLSNKSAWITEVTKQVREQNYLLFVLERFCLTAKVEACPLSQTTERVSLHTLLEISVPRHKPCRSPQTGLTLLPLELVVTTLLWLCWRKCTSLSSGWISCPWWHMAGITCWLNWPVPVYSYVTLCHSMSLCVFEVVLPLFVKWIQSICCAKRDTFIFKGSWFCFTWVLFDLCSWNNCFKIAHAVFKHK